eukprot:CAMPEP_0119155992 /NCGR_PEP_ID=MMETSP1310-20130426/52027_1 /TAXON_ID=464262 /ORGANISM="Genus nov. species nov., Strain RCC2339" /LENGTH=1475 /DNA_ID=CAMNT_0007148599 /DNA_START=154 /DNA_END=4581 /DNA_ORIENTATION=+
MNASWENTPLLLEALEFVAEKAVRGALWRLLDAGLAGVPDEAVAMVVGESLPPLSVSLLNASLAVRRYSPRVAAHRNIAAQLWDRVRLSGTMVGCGDEIPEQWVYFPEQERAVCTTDHLDEALAELQPSAEDCDAEGRAGESHLLESIPLGHDYPADRTLGAPLVSFFAFVPSDSFGEFHRRLVRAAEGGQIWYQLRHNAHISGVAKGSVWVQGYEARLDLKNMEYKAIDDSHIDDYRDDDEGVDVDVEEAEEKLHLLDDGESGAIDPDASVAFYQEMSPASLAQLAMKVCNFIVQAEAPLAMMADIVKNLPSYAQVITESPMSRDVRTRIVDVQTQLPFPRLSNFLLVNGHAYRADELTPFQFLTIMEKGLAKAQAVRDLGLPYDLEREVITMETVRRRSTRSLRLDVRHNAVTMFNDLSSPQYAQYAPEGLDVLENIGVGPHKAVYSRRNLVTVVFVMDPMAAHVPGVLEAMAQIASQGYPTRFGVVMWSKSEKGQFFAKLFYFFLNSYGPSQAAMTVSSLLANFGDASMEETVLVLAQNGIDATQIEKFWAQSPKIRKMWKGIPNFLRNIGVTPSDHFGPMTFVNGRYSGITAGADDSNGPNELWSDMAEQIYDEFRYLKELWENGEIDERLPMQNGIYDYVLSRPGVLSTFPQSMFDASSATVNMTDISLPNSEGLLILPAVEKQDHTKAITFYLRGDFNQAASVQSLISVVDTVLRDNSLAARVILLEAGDTPSTLSKVIGAALHSQLYSRLLRFLDGLKELVDTDDLDLSVSWSCDVTCEDAMIKLASSTFNDGFAAALSMEEERMAQKWEKSKTVSEMLRSLVPGATALLLSSTGSFTAVGETERDTALSPVEIRVLAQQSSSSVEQAYSQFMEIAPQITVHESDPELYLSDTFMRIAQFLVANGSETRVGLPEIHQRRHSLGGTFKGVLVVPGETSGSVADMLDLTIVVDPLSKGANRLAKLLSWVRSFFGGLSASIYFNPASVYNELPTKYYYDYVLDTGVSASSGYAGVKFSTLPTEVLLTLEIETPPTWMVQSTHAQYDLDNIRIGDVSDKKLAVTYELSHILIEGQCEDEETKQTPQGLQLYLGDLGNPHMQDTIVMLTMGYYQLKGRPGLWKVGLADGRASEIYEIANTAEPFIVVDSYEEVPAALVVAKKPGMENEKLIESDEDDQEMGLFRSMFDSFAGEKTQFEEIGENETIHVFSVATGHLYERFLKIMILSTIRHTKNPVKFWLLQNYFSPQFKETLIKMATKFGFEFEFVTYKWPVWLNAQEEKQRRIWGYKILFLDVLFPLSVEKIIYVDADLVVRGDLRDLANIDMKGAVYGFVPFCNDRPEIEGFRFWNQGFWRDHLQGNPYHISALYMVDLNRFRRLAAGDRLRVHYDMLSRDKGSLANLDQDLPNYMQSQLPIFSLPQEWLWCETWCSDDGKASAKAIDLCNNPMTKTPKLENAVRIVEEWTEVDQEARSV